MEKKKPTSGSFTKATAPNRGLFGEKNPQWKGGRTEYYRRIRVAVIEALGGKCIRCGFSDRRALQIDHINGGGQKERSGRSYTGQFNNHVLRSFLAKENKYQLLCANCNWIKRVENKEYRHL